MNINKCKNCGGDLKFSPLSQYLICNKCGSNFYIKSEEKTEKHSIDENFVTLGSKDKNVNITFSCNNCGAILKNSGLSYSTKCEYCGSNNVTADFSKSEVKPDAIIPFNIDKSNLIDNFKQNIKKKFFIPKAFKKSFNLTNAQAFYFPSFAFDANTSNSYRGVLSKTTRDSDGNTHIHRFKISGTKDVDIKDFAIESSSKLNQYQLDSIAPYNYKQAKSFNQQYLLGFETEYHDSSIQSCYKLSRPLIKKYIQGVILSKYTYDSVEQFDLTTNYFNEKYAYYLLPAYKISCKYKDKNYDCIMNGQTGKVGGNFPKSKLKIALVATLGFLIFALIFALPFILSFLD